MKFSDIDNYRRLRREGKISDKEFEYYKKFDDEYYGRKYFDEPLNKDFKKEDANRCGKHTKALKVNNVSYNEFLEYEILPGDISSIQESIKFLGPKGHIHSEIDRHRDIILEDNSPENIEKSLREMVVQTLLTIKYERRTQKLEKKKEI